MTKMQMKYICESIQMKNSTMFLILFFLISVLNGCATSRSNYLGDKTFVHLSSASKAIEPLGRVEPGVPLKTKISSSSPTIDLISTKGKYEQFELLGKKDQSYYLSVASICDCFGFGKKWVVPVIYLLDSDRNIVSSGGAPRGISQVMKGKFDKDGTYYLIVIADDRNEGGAIGTMHGPMAVGGSMSGDVSFSMTASATGTVFVHWEKRGN